MRVRNTFPKTTAPPSTIYRPQKGEWDYLLNDVGGTELCWLVVGPVPPQLRSVRSREGRVCPTSHTDMFSFLTTDAPTHRTR